MYLIKISFFKKCDAIKVSDDVDVLFFAAFYAFLLSA